MKLKNETFWICLIIAGSIYSCDKIDPPYTEPVSTSPVDTSGNDSIITRTRKVLLEDYTGHTCGNCPKAATAAEAAAQLYGDKVIVLGVHAGFFSVPVPPAPLPSGAPPGSYFMDFRTSEGTLWDSPQNFGISTVGNPNGMVNRKTFNGNRIISHSNWASAVQTILNDSADIGTKIFTEYSSATRELNITVRGKFYNGNITNNLKLVVLISESNIVTWQTDYDVAGNHVPVYNHKHVLRGTVNGAWGELFASPLTPTGTTIEKNYSFTLDNSWNENNCSVVVFIYDEVTLEVLQADEVKILN